MGRLRNSRTVSWLRTRRRAVVIAAAGLVGRERLFLVEPKLSAEGIQDKGAKTRVDFSLK
jgi:hypothetical protein